MSNYVCCIARLEGRYIREWVEHYLSLGFDKVIICDNNHEGEDDLDVINDYVEQGKVVIEDYRGLQAYQMKAYTKVYAKYGKEANILYTDVDEFLTLYKHKTIQEFVESFPQDWEQILINWKCYNDNDLVYYEDKPLKERFTQPIPFGKCIQYQNIPEDMHVKCIVKGGLPQVIFYSNPHVTTNPLVTYNASGRRCNNSPFQPIDWSVAQINHYVCKTVEEWCEKLRKGTGDRNYETFLQTYKNRFFGYCTPTQEKIEYMQKHGF